MINYKLLPLYDAKTEQPRMAQCFKITLTILYNIHLIYPQNTVKVLTWSVIMISSY